MIRIFLKQQCRGIHENQDYRMFISTDYADVLGPSGQDLQDVLGCFAAECEQLE